MGRFTRWLRPRVSAVRVASNRWLRQQAADVSGAILSVGTGTDSDGEGGRYREYFLAADSFTTSEPQPTPGIDLCIDISDAHSLASETYDGIFCSGVLEHVVDFHAAIREMHRLLKPGGILLLGLPFAQGIHLAPHDYWRFTEYGIREMLSGRFTIIHLAAIGGTKDQPQAYWIRATAGEIHE